MRGADWDQPFSSLTIRASVVAGPRRSRTSLGHKRGMVYYINLGIFAGFWIISMAFCVLAIWWSLFAGRARILSAAILSVLAVTIGCLGSTHFHITWETWTNGRLQYHYDTRWFFIAPLVLGSFALACTVWKKVRSSHVA